MNNTQSLVFSKSLEGIFSFLSKETQEYVRNFPWPNTDTDISADITIDIFEMPQIRLSDNKELAIDLTPATPEDRVLVWETVSGQKWLP